MPTGFIDTLPGGIEVLHRPAEKQWGDVDMDSPPKAVGHTTEGDDVPSYRQGMRDAPTFTVGRRHVYQHRAIGKVCGTLQNHDGGVQTNKIVRLQFELIGFSSRRQWLPSNAFQLDALAAIKEFAFTELDVPRDHVHPDDQDAGVVLATEKYHRRKEKFPKTPGWYGHVEIPENDHWDWGSLQWNDIGRSGRVDLVEALAFVKRVKAPDGTWATEEISPFFADRAALRDWAVVPDGSNADNADELRKVLFDALVENHVWVAKRRVPQDQIMG
jgi:hypothetical protein